MDELAIVAGADPVEFRLKHFRRRPWARRGSKRRRRHSDGRRAKSGAPGRGYGFAFARHKNLAAYAHPLRSR